MDAEVLQVLGRPCVCLQLTTWTLADATAYAHLSCVPCCPQLAIMSGRTLVFPDFPCHTKWAHRTQDTSACDDPTKVRARARCASGLDWIGSPYVANELSIQPSSLSSSLVE